MDRRELFQRIAGTVATVGAVGAAGPVVKVSTVAAAPLPVLVLIELADRVVDDDVAYEISRQMKMALEGTPLAGCRPLVLGSDAKLTFLDAHGRVCNQDLRMLPEGGSE